MRSSKTQARLQARRRNRRIGLGVVAIVAFLGVVLTAHLTGGRESDDTRAASAPFIRREQHDPMAIGDVDAPVVLAQWTDMRCPFCAVFSREMLPVLRREYVDTGKVRLEVNDVSFFGEQSADGAVAARAAAEQGRFFEYLSALYAKAPEKGHPDLPRATLVSFAREAGVPDIARFTADLDRPLLHSAAQASNSEAAAIGVTTVPFFVAGDKSLSGAQSIPVFREFLDAALAAAS
ncbi:thioredoxin domain-containing protein [Actinoplanes sp. NPDC023714]|uniref:DsbA family protein n=1 Tax=Actinoplanes sp. NPDC023714 TaxID=3154322 RepID=UPI0033C17B00